MSNKNYSEVGLASSSTTTISWSDIDMTGSSLEDIQDHGHSILNECGSNTHSQIDSHIADNCAHGVSGNLVGDRDSQTLSNKTLQSPVLSGTLSGDALLDEEDFSSSSAGTVSSSRSIKQYVDNSVSGSASIDDSCVSATSCWSSEKVNTDLSSKADSSSVPAINDSSTASTEVWSSENVSQKMRVIKGDYSGGPAYTEGTPFRFNINDLASTIEVSKVFVTVWGYKTNLAGDLLSSLKIEWNVTTSDADYIIEFLIYDAEGNPYQNPENFGTSWSDRKVKLQFHAYYVSDMPDATFIE